MSLTLRPASCCFKMETICVSVNRVFFMLTVVECKEKTPVLNCLLFRGTYTSIDEIEATNAILGNRISKQYLEFLKVYNGCTLFIWKNFSGFEFYSCAELVKQNQ